jgi:(p)ppGpp synthase/HD superfamily hydrolase
LKTIEDFYSLAGLGKIVINRKFIERLLPSEKVEEKRESFLGKVVTMVTKKAGGSLEILDRDGHRISLARCCSPIKGEPTIGYLTSGKGITIHSQRCPLVVKERLDNQRILEVSWENYPAGNFRGKLCILSIDSPGILAKVAQAIAEADGNITKAEVNTFPEKKAEIRLSIVINDIKHLEQITKKLTLIKGVFSVERV